MSEIIKYKIVKRRMEVTIACARLSDSRDLDLTNLYITKSSTKRNPVQSEQFFVKSRFHCKKEKKTRVIIREGGAEAGEKCHSSPQSPSVVRISFYDRCP